MTAPVLRMKESAISSDIPNDRAQETTAPRWNTCIPSAFMREPRFPALEIRVATRLL
jgi:hypothetical protein